MRNRLNLNFTNHKIGEEVYLQKRTVLRFVYELKNEGFILPRVEVKIGKPKNCNTLGLAILKENKIYISDSAFIKGENFLRHTVYHELLHAIYGCEHDKKCHLMNAYQPSLVYGKNKLVSIFKKYYNKYNNIKQLEVAWYKHK